MNARANRISADVLVVGAGSAGATAALTTAREGTDVLLLERYGFLGGISTQVLDTFYGFYTPGAEARKVVGGTPDLVLDELAKRDASIHRPNSYGAGVGITYDVVTLKMVWDDLIADAGVRLLLHTFVVDVLTDGDRVCGVLAVNKAGLVEIRARVIIDATGDADVAHRAGAQVELASPSQIQSLTTTFRVGGVVDEVARSVPTTELHRLMGSAAGSGDFDLPRREGSIHRTPIAGVMHANMVRVTGYDPTDPEELTLAELEGRRQAREYVRFLRSCVPGYSECHLLEVSTQIGIRESRRIHGAYRLSRQDVLAGTQFEDAIALCGAPIEDHHPGEGTRWEYLPEGSTYGIPLRTLLPSVGDLLVAGRCFSADHDAHASARSMAQCMAMGQAAAITAVRALRAGVDPHEVDASSVRSRLTELGAVL